MNTIPVVFNSANVVEAWRVVAADIVTTGERFNVMVHIADPCTVDTDQLDLYDPKQIVGGGPSVYDVANTIFPDIQGLTFENRDGFYAYYRRVYARGMKRRAHRTKWGTYFQRLVEFGGEDVNQLERIVSAISTWKVVPRAAFVVHLSAASLDRPRPLGAPCWQYGEFIRDNDNRLSLIVAYRSHDYFLKALGNFVGLGRLLHWVCQQTGFTAGSLTCLSTFAHVGNMNVKTRELLSNAG